MSTSATIRRHGISEEELSHDDLLRQFHMSHLMRRACIAAAETLRNEGWTDAAEECEFQAALSHGRAKQARGVLRERFGMTVAEQPREMTALVNVLVELGREGGEA